MTYLVKFDAIDWESPMRGVRQKIHRADGRVLRLVEYSTDMTPHWCSKGHLGYVVEGRLEVGFRDRTEVFGPGDGVCIPRGPEHAHRAAPLTSTVTAWFVEEA